MNDNINPPLDLDLATVDTSFPLLAPDTYDLRISKVELRPTANGVGKMIHLELETINPATSIKGDSLGVGVRVFHNVNYVPTGKATWDMVKQNVAQLVQGARVQGATLRNVEQWAPTLQGQVVRCKVGYVPEGSRNGKTYRAQNEITAFLKQ